MEKGSLGYQMRVLNRLEQQGKISTAAKATWVAGIIAGKVTSIVGLNLDFTIPEQKGLFNIARKADTQFGFFGNIAGKVKAQCAGTGVQIAGKVEEQKQILPGVQIAGNATIGQAQVMPGVQIAGKAGFQGQPSGIQLAGTIDNEQNNILGIQYAMKNHGVKQWGLKMIDNRP